MDEAIDNLRYRHSDSDSGGGPGLTTRQAEFMKTGGLKNGGQRLPTPDAADYKAESQQHFPALNAWEKHEFSANCEFF